MPYLKRKDPELQLLLNKYKLDTGPALAKVLGVSPKTAYRRYTDVSTLTVGDLDKINRYGHVPIEEIRQAI